MPTIPPTFNCYLVDRDDAGKINAGISHASIADLPEGDVTIRVDWSSLNYKDALAASGHKGVVRQFPHVPGIDAAGVVQDSSSDAHAVGQEVIVTGYELGAERWGGWSDYIRVPADWVVPLPDGLSAREAMVHGTAGFTAAQCIQQIQHHGIRPEDGDIVVTGATGGVGCLAVKLLAKLGYSVTASTGKPDARDWLIKLGAAEVIDRGQLDKKVKPPLMSARWAGAVDTVGGATLETILSETKVLGCVAACGLVGGIELKTTVYPFILRGVTLAGITSALCPRDVRLDIWDKLAGVWRLTDLDELTRIIELSEVAAEVERILEGNIRGRVVIRLHHGNNS